MVYRKLLFYIFLSILGVMSFGTAAETTHAVNTTKSSTPLPEPALKLKKPYVICVQDFTVAAGAADGKNAVKISTPNPGADYLEAELGKYRKVFSCMDRTLFAEAKKNMKMPPRGPRKYLQDLSRQTGAMFLIEVKIMPVRVRENKRNVYGMTVGRTEYSFDVTLNLTNLVQGQSVYRQTYSTIHMDERPLTSNYFEKDIFHTMLKNAAAQISEDLNSQYGEEDSKDEK